MTIHLLSYNNYYNRILRRAETVEEYSPYILKSFYDINVNPNDGVFTEITISWEEDTIPDYLIVENEAGGVIGRWYIIEMVRTRLSQYKLTLFRDLLAEYKNEIMNCDTFIEKGSISASSPLLYNSEAMSLNQIKTSETLLKDASGCAWVVGYTAKNATSANLKATITLPAQQTDTISLGTDLEDWEFYGNISQLDGAVTGNPAIYTPASSYKFITDNARGVGPRVLTTTIGDGSTTESSGESLLDPTTLNPMKGQNTPTIWNKIKSSFVSYGLERIKTEALDYAPGVLTTAQWNYLSQFRNKKVVDASGRLYKFSLMELTLFPTGTKTYIIPYGSGLGITLAGIYRNSGAFDYFNNTRNYTLKVATSEVLIVVERLYSEEYNFTMADTRLKTSDAPYDIFAIPYGYSIIKDREDNFITITRPDLAIAAAMALQKNAQDFIYDIQLLPYCPVPGLIKKNPGYDPDIIVDDNLYTPIMKGDTVEGVIFHVGSSQFSFNINKKITLPLSNIEQKVVNQCDKYRLCSPNYSNYFDFSLTKNGTINYFEVDCQYKPFSPYIHVVPQFGRLYGGDFNDPRGLVLGGDFSLPQVTSAWRQFEINNKNYQLSFDRQMQSMELQHNIQESLDVMNAISGTISGTASGIKTGLMAGGGWGAAIGGLAGFGVSALGGAMDVEANRQLRDDAKDLTRDLYGYQLDNIRALPITLSKISPFTPNNKIFPVLEYYTCTEEEKLAFVNKVAYNGMTVGVIGKIYDYLYDWEYLGITNKKFIKGKIVRLDIQDDYHIANAIAAEINKGVYIEI